jgi:hypothetical protein
VLRPLRQGIVSLPGVAWNIAAASVGTACRIPGNTALLPVAAYRVDTKGKTEVLVAPMQEPPSWVPLKELEMLSPLPRSRAGQS